MYIPAAFKINDPAKLAAVMREHSFATLISVHDGSPFASHLPLLYDAVRGEFGTIRGHMSRANPLWQHFAAGGEALVIFHGPHSYISPRWYVDGDSVPTWNYVVVHAYGIPAVIEDSNWLSALVDETVAKYESDPSLLRPIPPASRANLLRGIVGFEIPISRLEGKFKLGQNRSESDRRATHEALVSSDKSDARALSEVYRAEFSFRDLTHD